VLHLGAEAQEALLGSMASPRVLHLATHGFVVEATAETTGPRAALLSSVALAGANATKDTAEAQEGVLFGYEIEVLDLAGTELVVVSACETGLGTTDATDGIYSLARAFRLAGAGAVLVTLRPVDDALTAAFMEAFCSTWLRTPGTHPAEALAAVKNAWADSPDQRRNDPRSWAPFITIENSG